MIEFKSKIDKICVTTRFVLPPVPLTAAQASAYGEVPLVIIAFVETHRRTAIKKISLDNLSALLITSVHISEIFQLNYISLREIKDAALKAEMLRKEKNQNKN